MLNNQIKSEDRVYKYGEVYTNDREIEAMLGLIPSEMLEVNKTFLENKTRYFIQSKVA